MDYWNLKKASSFFENRWRNDECTWEIIPGFVLLLSSPPRQFSEMGIIFFGKQYIFLEKNNEVIFFYTCPSLLNMNCVVFVENSKIVAPTSSSFLLVSANDALSSNWFNTCVETLHFTHRPHYHSYHHHYHPDMEFVTSGTSDINVKNFWAEVIFSRMNLKITLFVKFAEFRLEFSQNSWSEFVFE